MQEFLKLTKKTPVVCDNRYSSDGNGNYVCVKSWDSHPKPSPSSQTSYGARNCIITSEPVTC